LVVSSVAVVGGLAGSTAGCSLSLSGPDPQASVRDTPRCDTGKGAVALDGVMGAVFAVPALASFGDDQAELGVVLGLASVAYIASAVRGSGGVDACRAAAHELKRPALLPTLAPPLAALIAACWDPVPERRPTAKEVCERLEHIFPDALTGETPPACACAVA
jgi:hypothetical protein